MDKRTERRDALRDALDGMTTLRCETPGCPFRIRFRGVSDDSADRLDDLVSDHSRH